MSERATERLYRVQRWHGAGTGCHGVDTYYEVGDNRTGHSGISPETLLDQELPEGTVVRVTVEIVSEGAGWGGPAPRSWHHYKGYEHADDCVSGGS